MLGHCWGMKNFMRFLVGYEKILRKSGGVRKILRKSKNLLHPNTPHKKWHFSGKYFEESLCETNLIRSSPFPSTILVLFLLVEHFYLRSCLWSEIFTNRRVLRFAYDEFQLNDCHMPADDSLLIMTNILHTIKQMLFWIYACLQYFGNIDIANMHIFGITFVIIHSSDCEMEMDFGSNYILPPGEVSSHLMVWSATCLCQ